MNRRTRGAAILAFAVGTIAASTDPAEAQRGAPNEAPHILLLVAEDLSPRIGAFGDALARTPRLDRLAAEGIRFTNVHTTAGVCAPSRAALMLGRHQIETGGHPMRTASYPGGAYTSVPPPDAKAFPERLRAAGYFTYQHGKLDYQFSGPMSGSGPPSIWDAEDNAGHWADRDPGQPFFGMVNFMATHESGVAPPLGHWPRSALHLVLQLGQAWLRWGFTDHVVPTDPEALALPAYYPDLPEIRSDVARHYDNVQVMDAQVGAILDRLEQDGLADSTIVIWTTDHGDGLPRAKRELFQSGLHVPMIVRWPAAYRPAHLVPGEVDDRLVSFVDLPVAILGQAGVPIPPDMHGHDFLDPTAPARAYVYASRDRMDEWDDRQRAVFDGRFKYIRSFRPDVPGGVPIDFRENLASMRAWRRAWEDGGLRAAHRAFFEPPGEERLFDVAHDPDEVRDLARDPAMASVLDRLRAAYAEFAAHVPDLGETPEAELRAGYWPDDAKPETRPPTFSRAGGRIRVSAPDVGASIEVRRAGDRWRLYTEPIFLSRGDRLEARAVRYGWETSDEVAFVAP